MSSIIEVNQGRRLFLKQAAIITSSILLPSYMLLNPLESFAGGGTQHDSRVMTTEDIAPEGETNFWQHTRTLLVKRSGESESHYVTYWDNGALNTQGYIKLCYLMMDKHVNQAVQMDIQLLNLMYAIQGWLRINGINLPMLINSGYRSARTNRSIEGAAKNSMHLYGKAADIRIPGIPIDYLGKLSAHFSAGGVGFYVRKNFVHIDTGRVRKWKG